MDTIQNKSPQSRRVLKYRNWKPRQEKKRIKTKKSSKALNDKVKYADLNKLVKKKRRTRARRKRKELILETLEARKGPRQINKHRNKQMIMSSTRKNPHGACGYQSPRSAALEVDAFTTKITKRSRDIEEGRGRGGGVGSIFVRQAMDGGGGGGGLVCMHAPLNCNLFYNSL